MSRCLTLLALGAVASLASAAQTEVLHTIERPAGTPSSWGERLFPLHDLDGDGVPELAIGTRNHGGGLVATVHSGADGSRLFDLVAPMLPMFVGHAVASVSLPGGAHELVVLGAKSGASGSPDGWIGVYSGANGALLRTPTVPPGYVFGEAPIIVLGDVDGDGAEDFASGVAADLDGNGFAESAAVQCFSSATGAPLYPDVAEASGVLPRAILVRLPDRDGDALAEFALVVRKVGPSGTPVTTAIEVRSGLTGDTLAHLTPPHVGDLTGNNEPLIATADGDGDGVADLAIGGVFSGFVVQFSSVTGAALAEWSCANSSEPCFGARLVEAGDLDFDGVPELIALETNVFGSGGMRLFGLDPATGAVLFEEHVPTLSGGYSSAHRIVALPGVDAHGFASFALFEDAVDRVTVRRFAPELGNTACTPAVGPLVSLRALGSASFAANQLVLALDQAPPQRVGLVLCARGAQRNPFTSTATCATANANLYLRTQPTDALGRVELGVDLPSSSLTAGSSWTFQALFRDVAPRFSRALTVELLP